MVSVVVPCRNEERYIKDFMDSLILQDYGISKMEIFIVDGMSSDKTVQVVNEYKKLYSSIFLLHNEKQLVSSSLNLAISQAKGDLIIRMDVHCIYPYNYISTLLKYSYLDGVENVGCQLQTCSKSGTCTSKSISLALASYIGVGNSLFRTGVSKPKYVDTVPFGCFHKSIFDRIGNFDIDLVRNQDDEFNGRIIKNGGKILLIPDISVIYFQREDVYSLFKMYFQYGYYKKLVNIKLKRLTNIRQLVPLFFVVFLISTIPFLLFDLLFLNPFYIFVIILYLLLIAIESVRLSFKNRSLKMFYNLLGIFFIIHFSYGLGYFLSYIKSPSKKPI